MFLTELLFARMRVCTADDLCNKKLDVVLVVDSSRSIDEAKYDLLLNFIKNFAGKFSTWGPTGMQVQYTR